MCPTPPAVWSRTRCPCWKRVVSLPSLSVQLISVSVSSQLPVLLQCLLPPHVQSGECSMSKHPNLHEAQVNNLILDTHHNPRRPLHSVCRACVCVYYLVLSFKKRARIVASLKSQPINRVKNDGLVWRSDQVVTVIFFFLFEASENNYCEETVLGKKKRTWIDFHCPPVSQLSLCMYVPCVYMCVQEGAQDGERGKVCVCVCVSA